MDDDAKTLSPFFAQLLSEKGYSVLVLDKWGDAVRWLKNVSVGDRRAIVAVVLDIMFPIPKEDKDLFAEVSGQLPNATSSLIAGWFLVGRIKQALPDAPIVVLTNYPFDATNGGTLRTKLEAEGVRVFTKPAREDFYAWLDEQIAASREEG